MKRIFILVMVLILGMVTARADAQFQDVLSVGIEQVEVAEASGDTLVMVTVDGEIGNVNYPCGDSDTDRLLVAVLPGLDPESSWKMLHATLLAAMSRGVNVRIRMGDCAEYKPGRMARKIIGVVMLGS